MATDEQFNNALKKLCIQDSYDSEKRPASVDRIIFPRSSNLQDEAKILLKYFYQVKRKSKPTKIIMFINNISIETHSFTFWKLQDYVKFIRTKRDEMFPNDYKKKSRKFISRYPYVRSTLISQYEKDLYAR